MIQSTDSLTFQGDCGIDTVEIEVIVLSAVYEQKSAILEFYQPNTLEPLPHLHKELELIYIVEGGCTAFANGKSYYMTSGDIFLSFPYQIHYYQNAQPGKYIVLCFPTSILPTMETDINNNDLRHNTFHAAPGSDLEHFFSSLRCVSTSYAIAERCAYVTLIMSKLLSKCEMSPLQQTASMTVKSILEYCSKHYTENLSLDTIAKSLHLNKYYISHTINHQVNMRLSTFINSLRVNASCKLLKETDKRITDIAQAVGFDTIRSYNRAFLQIVGMTPKQYREKALKQTSH